VAGTAKFADTIAGMGIFSMEEGLHYTTVLTRFFGNDLLGAANSYNGWRNYLEAPLFYCGLLTLMLIPQAFTHFSRRQKMVYGTLLGFWLLLLVFPYFRYGFYLFMGNYYKGSLSLFVPVTCLFVGLHALHFIYQKKEVNLVVLGATLLILLVLLFYPYNSVRGILDGGFRNMTAVFLVVYSALLYALTFKKNEAIIWSILLMVCLAEVGFVAHTSIDNRATVSSADFYKKAGYNDATNDAVAYLKKTDKDFYRVDKDYSSTPANHASINDAQVQGYYGTSCYSSFNQKYYIDFLQAHEIIGKEIERETRWAPNLVSNPFLQTIVGVKYNLTKADDPFYTAYGYADEIKTFGDIKLLKNKYVMPLGTTYQQYILRSDFDKLPKMSKGIAMLDAFVVENDNKALANGFATFATDSIPENYEHKHYTASVNDSTRQHLNITQHNNNTIKGTIDLSATEQAKTMLYFSIPYDMGWQATVNGQSQPLHLINVGMMGLLLDKGKHEIELSFVPPYSGIGFMVALGALGIYLALIGWYFKNKGTKTHNITAQKYQKE